ncbi:hypothetical protein [Kordiimonas aquimaris]|uniref:hypothetical protein n=1 Tax=Kordiimonas aquimaris TaxID=707591 RepID=UPI0021D04D7D|nr:hypothetical protein [Kordiimonas aquimaris]
MFKVNFGNTDLLTQLDERGLSLRFQDNLARATAFAQEMVANGLPAFASQSASSIDLDEMDRLADRIRSSFKHLIVLGTGGSSLGAQAAIAIARYLPENISGQNTQIHTPDSVCPFEMDRLFAGLNPAQTHILAVSKSGTTAETLAQLLCCRSWIERVGTNRQIADHFTFITEPGKRALRSYAETIGAPVMDHPTDVGGRFSVLTNVGLLPVAVSGLSTRAIRQGATSAVNAFSTDSQTSAAVVGAACLYTLNQHAGINQTLLMPYAEALRAFTRWHGQLWGESLGKDGMGTTPIRAIGPVDQHSQLQLWLDGPNDKFCTFITAPSYGAGPRIDAAEAHAYGLDYMAGLTIGDTVTCQSKATQETLRKKGRMVREFVVDGLTEENIGALFVSFMLETVLTANLMGVDAYDQPAVEEGKVLTREYLAKLGDKD